MPEEPGPRPPHQTLEHGRVVGHVDVVDLALAGERVPLHAPERQVRELAAVRRVVAARVEEVVEPLHRLRPVVGRGAEGGLGVRIAEHACGVRSTPADDLRPLEAVRRRQPAHEWQDFRAHALSKD